MKTPQNHGPKRSGGAGIEAGPHLSGGHEGGQFASGWRRRYGYARSIAALSAHTPRVSKVERGRRNVNVVFLRNNGHLEVCTTSMEQGTIFYILLVLIDKSNMTEKQIVCHKSLHFTAC